MKLATALMVRATTPPWDAEVMGLVLSADRGRLGIGSNRFWALVGFFS